MTLCAEWMGVRRDICMHFLFDLLNFSSSCSIFFQQLCISCSLVTACHVVSYLSFYAGMSFLLTSTNESSVHASQSLYLVQVSVLQGCCTCILIVHIQACVSFHMKFTNPSIIFMFHGYDVSTVCVHFPSRCLKQGLYIDIIVKKIVDETVVV